MHALNPARLLPLFLLCCALPLQAQDTATLNLVPASSKLWIDGTSNRSNWTVHATEMTGSVTMKKNSNEVRAVTLTVRSNKIVSQKSTIMDRLMHETLKVETHPAITYQLSGATLAPGGTANTYTLQTTGRLTLAGTTKDVTMTVQGTKLANGHLRFTGEHPLLMTDYGLQPPSAMFGALRTGDRVVVHFDVVMSP
jgi:polyisoprenoid-binding protein YceI